VAGAVVKASYGRGKPAVGAAKAHVAYLVHRPDAWGNRQYRDLLGSLDVDKQAAYEAVDRAGADGSYVYRVVLSPDPREQDADKTLDLRTWGEAVMAKAEAEHPGLRWFAVEHQDPDHRHVHVVALTNERLDVDDFRQMRAAANDHAREHVRERNHSLVLDRDRERGNPCLMRC
jgi:hypothetical protein